MSIKRLLTAAVLCAVLIAPVAATAAPCSKHYSQKQFRSASRSAFRSAPYSKHEAEQLRKFARCQHSASSRRAVRRYYKGYLRGFKRRNPLIGTRVTGKVSWFGGPNDGSNSGTALGLPDWTPGIAIRPGPTYQSGQPFLGGYWRVRIGGRSHLERGIDIGPNQSTGRRIDVTSGSVGHFGFGTGNFPTDSIGTAVFVGFVR